MKTLPIIEADNLAERFRFAQGDGTLRADELKLSIMGKDEDDMLYCHPSEDRIVLSHALFWVMTVSVKG